MLCTCCPTKEVMSLLLLRSTQNSGEKWLFHMHFSQLVANQNGKKLESGHYIFWNCYIQGAARKKQYHRFFRRTLKISGKNYFYRSILGEQWHINIKKLEPIYFEIAVHMMFHERNNITASFAEHVKFWE